VTMLIFTLVHPASFDAIVLKTRITTDPSL
jgi:hypothetical protein